MLASPAASSKAILGLKEVLLTTTEDDDRAICLRLWLILQIRTRRSQQQLM